MSVWQTGQVFMPVYQARNSMQQPGTNICWRVGSIVWRSIVGSSQGFVGRTLVRGVVWHSWFGCPSRGSTAVRLYLSLRHRSLPRTVPNYLCIVSGILGSVRSIEFALPWAPHHNASAHYDTIPRQNNC